jgi:type VI secretion system secreted protein VgrG
MARYTQAGRPITVTTPLGEDVLLLVGFQGYEAVSQLFHFRLDLLAENASKVEFDKLMGQKITMTLVLPEDKKRFFNGICIRVRQADRDNVFTHYRIEIVPQFWLLTRTAQSRIFQHMTVPDILKKVLAGIDAGYQIVGTFEPRDYCVQYRETDFHFASRLMEEEGIYYFFKHSEQGHQMVLANTPQGHADMPEWSKLTFEGMAGGTRPEDRIFDWEKVQEWRSGKYTLWDHCFELPGKNLEAAQTIPDSVPVGKVTHKLKVGGNEKLEIYEYPGEYAQRFDGIDKSGGVQQSELQKIFTDNERTVGIRMQQEALPSLLIQGTGNCKNMVSGHKFNLERHFDADGQYLLTSVEHSASLSGDYRSGTDMAFTYENRFTCIPFALPFRPPRTTPKPTVQGSQTATVVGPAGEEIFTDKYGRVKVQFNWDREGQYNPDSSCWVRVGTAIAGRLWGMIHLPRIGQEVIVDFLEGDPDQPIVVGGVYNADQMPPYTLPDHKTKTSFKSHSSLGGGGFNEIRFEDKKGQEQVFIHGEKDLDVRVKKDRREWIGQDRHLIVKRDKRQTVEQDDKSIVNRDQVVKIGRDHHLKIGGKEAVEVAGSRSLCVRGDVTEEFKANHSQQVASQCFVKAKDVIVQGMTNVCLQVGGNFITINQAGIYIKGTTVYVNSGGAAVPGTPGGLVAPIAPDQALIADNADPGDKSPTYKNQPVPSSAPRHNPEAAENKEKKSWIEIELVDEAGRPVPGVRYRLTLPDGTTVDEGTLDERGRKRVEHIDPGNCKVTFPDLDGDAWEPK